MVRFHFIALAVFIAALWACNAEGADFPLGDLSHDGPATPEQISMYMPVKGELDTSAKAAVRYRETSEEDKWKDAHPLHRIRPKHTAGRTVSDAFAGVITGLKPGVSYAVEVTVTLGEDKQVKKLTAVTRPLPPAAGKATKIIKAGSSSAEVKSVFNGAGPGDVIQFENGTYAVDGLQMKKSGTKEKPIYFRGESRQGVILKDPTGTIIQFLPADNIIIENLTLEGSKTDSGTSAASKGVSFWNGGKQQERTTIRNVTFNGVDMGVVSWGNTKEILVYDCTLLGNNKWEASFINTNLTWNDDGIRVPGSGHAVFNNTLTGFGDSVAVAAGMNNIGVHFYRNDIRMTGDDAFESDYGVRNITFYDNRIHNAMTHISVDPMHGGPFFAFRNIAINIGRGPYKLNNKNTGFFLYNNTVVRTKGRAGWGWVQYANGPLVAWGYRNNILIFLGGKKLMAMEPRGMNPIDFNHNAWYPEGSVWWSKSGGSFGSMADARKKLAAVKPVFGTCTKRHENDIICEPDPFEEKIEFGADYMKMLTKLYVPKLKEKALPREAGVAIPGITDGFEGKAPDMGAIITGRPLPVWGDRNLKETE
ncbi:hypothetical protein ACFL6F_03335 [Planctomycetota bacterium]